MANFANGVAWVRMLYPSPMIGAPSALVIDVPPESRGRGLALDRYYAILIETDTERGEVERYLSTPMSSLVAPDLLDHRPSNIWSADVVISVFEPPAAGWPWLSVTRWPDTFAGAAADHGVPMARGHYTMEAFANSGELNAHNAVMIDGLRAHYPIEVRLLSDDRLRAGGAV